MLSQLSDGGSNVKVYAVGNLKEAYNTQNSQKNTFMCKVNVVQYRILKMHTKVKSNFNKTVWI